MQRKSDIFANKLINFLGFLGLVISVVGLIWSYKTGILTNKDKLASFLQDKGRLAPLVFFLIQFIQTVVPIIPGALTIPMGHMIFGFYTGFILNYTSILTGSIFLFFLCRKYGRRLVWILIGDKNYKKYVPLLDRKIFTRIFTMAMVLPFMPADMFCMLAGVSKMNWKSFVSILVFTKPISLIFYTLFTSTIIQHLFKAL